MVLGAVLGLLLLGGAAPASAHAALRGTDPDDGGVVASAPRHITLTFTESVGLLDDSLRVYDPANRRVATGEARHAPGRSDTARVSLPDGLGTGTFTVAWRVVSADSHPIAGAFTFSVGKPSPTTVSVPEGPDGDPVTGGLHGTARYAAYLGFALLVGALTFLACCRPPHPGRLRRVVAAGWWTLVAATAVLLVLRGPYEAGTGPAAALDPSELTRTATSRPGLALLARLALLLVAGALLTRLRRRSRAVLAAGTVLAVALALTWAAAEHASAGIQVPLAMASSVLHLLATGVWLGGLAALLTTLYRVPDDVPAAVVVRFSRLAFAAVAVLVGTGVYQSWRGLGSWEALSGTSYGRILVAKLAAVALLLAVAGRSRRWTARLVPAGAEARQERVPEPVPERVGGPPSRPRAERADGPTRPPAGDGPAAPEPDRRALRRSVLAEAAVGVVVLGLTTVLTGTLPGRAAAEAAAAAPATDIPAASVTTVPFTIGGARGKVQVTLDPGRVGRTSVQAVVFGPDGGLSTVPELRLSFTLPAQRIGPIDAKVSDLGGYWGTGSLNLPIPGTWTMKVTVRASDLDQVTVTHPIRVTP
ncbi:copper resistance CopC/CopD family protein [Streptomyces sp. NPDC004629]|uniref:copper resistance CopC/CopD family protein n=1 Tax=Streptomyces sp. NPDC004629 TaxID=3364705 RepID=UPI003687C5C9